MILQRMPAEVRDAFTAELHAARNAPDSAQFWQAAERAHILSQRGLVDRGLGTVALERAA